MTKVNFKEWFLQSFIPEVKEFMIRQNLDFKVLLLLDNAPAHPDDLDNIHPDVEIMFLPPNTASLIQPMDQSVISTFKSYYLRRVMKSMVDVTKINCDESQVVVKNFWKKFSILDAIEHIDNSWKEIQNSTLNKSWSKLLPQVVRSDGSSVKEASYEKCVQSLLRLGMEIGGEWFAGLTESEIADLVQKDSVPFSAEDIDNLLTEELEILEEQPTETKILSLIEDATTEAVANDPIVIRSLKFKYECEKAVQIYQELYTKMERRVKQKSLKDYFTAKN